MSDKPSFFAELQRRHVYKVGAMYCVAGWLLVQVATQVLPVFDITALDQRLIVLAVVAGLPVALVLAWVFDLTPQGIVRTDAQFAGAGVPRPRSMERRLNYLLGALLLLAVGFAAFERLHGSRGAPDSGPAPAHSIAVLPLINESGDPSREYFSDGLSEELISALAQVGGLKVIGRSSSFRFKGGTLDSRSIGEQLGVASLLEGTVRQQGDRVRIVAELINAADGRELWSRTYDRQLKDVFAVQAEIAAAVADSLRLQLLGGSTAGAGRQTANAQAHQAYLQGHFFFERRNLQDYVRAVQAYDRAVALDPGYALAYSERSEAWTWINDQTIGGSRGAVDKARADARKAVELDPGLAEAHAALGWVLFFDDWKFSEGLAELRRAQQLAPDNGTVGELMARVLVYVGRADEAEQLARRVIALNPLDFQPRENLARVLSAEGRYQESFAQASKSVELQPNAASSRRWQVIAAVFLGNPDAALAQARQEPGLGYRAFEEALALSAGPDRNAADAAIDTLIHNYHDGMAYQVAEIYAWRKDYPDACRWLQTSFDQHDTGLLTLMIDPLMQNMRGQPCYRTLFERMKLDVADVAPPQT